MDRGFYVNKKKNHRFILWYNETKVRGGNLMKLVLAIVSNDDSSVVSNALNKENYQVTRLATTGGFLRAGNTTLIIGVDDDRVEGCLEIIGNECSKRTEVVPSTASYDIGRYASFPVEVQVGGATVFVMDVEQFHKL
ncbi:hypothetical protein HMPREF0357_10731 [Erysipelothrix rhusiopathiae ATCC 19414]|uniref:Transcriptional regulator n=2 Tax=Erysipelothrix TaxID=1647 RepID=E7FWL3_ERYRH|nr:hypothetical protein HMPREF0357_10731 [Erysipelothrix rhusiopathiae ATCC 19414]